MIKTFKVDSYRGNKVYYRCIKEKLWEYLVIINGELYAGQFDIKPRAMAKKTDGLPYSNKEINVLLHMLRKAAEATVDTVANKEAKEILDNKAKNEN